MKSLLEGVELASGKPPLGSLFAQDQVVIPERQYDIHLAIMRFLGSIGHGPPQRTCGPLLSSFRQQCHGANGVSLVVSRRFIGARRDTLNQSLFAEA